MFFGFEWPEFARTFNPSGFEWPEFARTFNLSWNEDDARAALSALQRLLPLRYELLVAQRATLVDGLNWGRRVLACEDLPGFGELCRRMDGGDEGASGELRLVASLVHLGYRLVLEPDNGLGSGKNDASIDHVDGPVFFEVFAPQLSYPNKEARSLVKSLSPANLGISPGETLNVDFVDTPNRGVIEKVKDSAADLALGASLELPGIARLRFTPSLTQGSALVAVSYPIQDERLQTHVNEKAQRQLNSLRKNILVFPVAAYGGSPARLAERAMSQLTPDWNICVGGIGFFQSFSAGGGKAAHNWEFAWNAHATHPIPSDVIEKLESLKGVWV